MEKPRDRKKMIIWLSVAIIAIIVVLLIVFLSQPATGVVEKAKAPAAKASARTLKHYSDKYVAFDYPALYSQINAEDAGAGYLDALRFSGPNYKNSLLAIAVHPGKLGNEPSVSQRQKDTTHYLQKPITLKGSDGLLFVKLGEGSFEESAFISHNGGLVTIVISDPSGENIDKDFQTVLSNWSWPQ